MTGWARLAVLGVSACVGGLSGCVTVNDPSRPEIRELPTPPPTVVPDRIFLSVGPLPEDSDGNGYHDTLTVTVYLFSESLPQPVQANGGFRLQLVDGETPIAEWVYERDEVAQAARKFPAGVGYLFSPSLNEGGGDRLNTRQARLVCQYLPADGGSLTARGRPTVAVGPVR